MAFLKRSIFGPRKKKINSKKLFFSSQQSTPKIFRIDLLKNRGLLYQGRLSCLLRGKIMPGPPGINWPFSPNDWKFRFPLLGAGSFIHLILFPRTFSTVRIFKEPESSPGFELNKNNYSPHKRLLPKSLHQLLFSKPIGRW